jgi:hypothetical protein
MRDNLEWFFIQEKIVINSAIYVCTYGLLEQVVDIYEVSFSIKKVLIA